MSAHGRRGRLRRSQVVQPSTTRRARSPSSCGGSPLVSGRGQPCPPTVVHPEIIATPEILKPLPPKPLILLISAASVCTACSPRHRSARPFAFRAKATSSETSSPQPRRVALLRARMGSTPLKNTFPPSFRNTSSAACLDASVSFPFWPTSSQTSLPCSAIFTISALILSTGGGVFRGAMPPSSVRPPRAGPLDSQTRGSERNGTASCFTHRPSCSEQRQCSPADWPRNRARRGRSARHSGAGGSGS